MEVRTFVIVTTAFGTTAPDWSRTMPTMVAVSSWAAATAGKAQAQARTHATAIERCGITHLLVATTVRVTVSVPRFRRGGIAGDSSRSRPGGIERSVGRTQGPMSPKSTTEAADTGHRQVRPDRRPVPPCQSPFFFVHFSSTKACIRAQDRRLAPPLEGGAEEESWTRP